MICRVKPLRVNVGSFHRMYTAVVSAASRGLGLEFTRQLLQRPDTTVIAVFRSKTPEDGLQHLLDQFGERRLRLVSDVDLTCPSSIVKAIETIQTQCTEKNGSSTAQIDLLINSAGILGNNSPSMPGPERSVLNVDPDWLLKSMQVNFMSHVLMTQGIAPLMKRKFAKNEAPTSDNIGKIINISARVGSIGDNKLGGWVSYRCSKSALNQFTRTASLELKRNNCAVISLHPGTCDTNLSKPFQKNLPADQLMSVESACSSMMSVINSINLDNTGNFYSYDGKTIEW